MSAPTLIVPGLHGSDGEHWQAQWRRDHPDAILVEQADWSNPQADRWLANLEAAIAAHPHALIVAHSLGTVLTARLAKSRIAPLVAAALLVAPADITRTEGLHKRSYEFGDMPQDILPFPALVVASRDDIYMPFDKARDLATAWGSPLHDLGYAGHINIASGYGRWPAGYALAAQLADCPKRATA
jgi:predicted alpha/beta hydrolase family esterase